MRTEIQEQQQPLNRREAAQCLGVAVVTVDRLVAKGELQHFKVGKSTRFTRQHIGEFIARHTRPVVEQEAA